MEGTPFEEAVEVWAGDSARARKVARKKTSLRRDFDICEAQMPKSITEKDYKPVTAKDYMSANLVTLDPDMDILKAVGVLVDKRIMGAPVVDKQGNLVGILSEKDCLQVALQASYHEESATQVADYMNPAVKTVDVNTSIPEIADLFLKLDYRLFAVMKDNRLVGQICRRDVLKALGELW